MKKILALIICFFTSNIIDVTAAQPKEIKEKSNIVEVAALEDLMREHGMLNRLLLIYEEILNRFSKKQFISAATIHDTASLIGTFIEDYHEKLEEEFIFSRFKKANVLTEVISTLLDQHQAGRKLTDTILDSTRSNTRMNEAKKEIIGYIKTFIRMYRVHEAWEDTVVFPRFHTLITADEYDKLGDIFETREQQMFGKDGFENVLQRVIALEKKLEIYGLSRVTPS